MVAAGFGTTDELQGTAPGDLGGAGDPDPAPCKLLQGPLPVNIVYQNTCRGNSLRDPHERPRQKQLQVPQTLVVHTKLVRDLL